MHRALVLRSARPLLEADPALGLSVFLDQQRQGLSHGLLVQRRGGGFQGGRRPGVGGGGAGSAEGRRTEGRLAPHDVVSFLKTVTPSEVCAQLGTGGFNNQAEYCDPVLAMAEPFIGAQPQVTLFCNRLFNLERPSCHPSGSARYSLPIVFLKRSIAFVLAGVACYAVACRTMHFTGR